MRTKVEIILKSKI